MDKDTKSIKDTADEFYVAKFHADIDWDKVMGEARAWYKKVYLDAKDKGKDKEDHKTRVISKDQINNLTDRHYDATSKLGQGSNAQEEMWKKQDDAKEWYAIEYAEAKMVEEEEELEDMVHSPPHYSILPGQNLEVIDVINVVCGRFKGNQAYYIGNVLKYILRAGLKGDVTEDLRKARVYLDWLLQHRGMQ